MPLVMMVNSSDSVMPARKGDGERRFGLAHEDAGGDVDRFRAAGAHDVLHHHGHGSHDHCMTPR